MEVKNIAFYKFVELTQLPEIRAELKAQAKALEVSGTIILAPEGINGFLAGPTKQVDEMTALLRSRPEFQDLEFKQSFSDHTPFQRLKVKLKKEIIPFGKPEIRPQLSTGDRLDPLELKRWLDEDRPVWIVDTRNDYEVKHGTFKNAVDLGLKTFRDFPEKWKEVAPRLRDRPVVMFCTGGIRCEKATAFAAQAGLHEVYQLEGGILKYFEKCNDAHYNGDCFVFDERVALDPDLKASSAR
ncbi:sulfurtransferase [bacterium]|nr:sulfurtransferase [bacterium]